MSTTEDRKAAVTKARCWVIKVGSSLVTDDGLGLNHERIKGWATQISALKRKAYRVVLVSSGAVAEGVRRLKWRHRPQSCHQMQAAAATGQTGLMHAYEARFRDNGFYTAQVLLTHDDLSNRMRYLNARATLTALLALDVIPIVNENDTVATDEIQFGDNDTLAALAANLVDADVLLLLTDQDGLYDRNPDYDPAAVLIRRANVDDQRLNQMADIGGKGVGRGGMITKIAAARRAAASGTFTIIASGHEDAVISRITSGEELGTWLQVDKQPLTARKQWIFSLKPAGVVILDDGACEALQHRGKSLLPVGITSVQGDFERGAAVECRSKDGVLIASGLANYSSKEAHRIMGKHSTVVKEIVGSSYEAEFIHCDNLALVD